MKYGLLGINSGLFARHPSALPDIARHMQDAGFDSAWAGEHYALPAQSRPQAPPARTMFLDPFISLAIAATSTERLLLATGVIVVPLHSPAILAKKVATLDLVSGGRFLFGVGVGYLREEFEAVGADLTTRGRRFEDSMTVMKALWSGEPVDVSTDSFTFSGIQARPTPVTKPFPRMVFGGYAAVSYRRAVAMANGWYGYWLDPLQAAQCVRKLGTAASTVQRPTDLGRLEVSVTPPGDLPINPEVVDRYRDVGVDRLVVLPNRNAFATPDQMRRFIDELALTVDPHSE
jgi:probable F420-dependent oxidoreductase